MNFLPKTKLGIWSVGLIISMPVLFSIGSAFVSSLYKSVPAGNSIFEDVAARPALALTMLAGMATGIFSFITGIFAIVRQRDYSLLVYTSAIIGALLIIFLVSEIIVPH